MEQLLCPRCGETLVLEGDLLDCPYCNASFQRETAERSSEALKSILNEEKAELLANRKRHLWDVAHEKYPSKEKVVDASNAVISINADDFLARIYLHSHDRDPLKLNQILASEDVSTAEASEAFRWLLPSLSSRTVGPLHDFVDRHFSGKERFERITELESEASKISQGIYEPALPRDVFLCYSSKDMAKVVGLMDLLEQNGFACFAAFRNLRHGKGAQEDYLSAIKTAMKSCDVLVFVSSESSRSMDCDAMKVELPYFIQEFPDKPRVEFVIEDYGDTPFMVRRTLKRAFPSQEHCLDEEDLMERIQSAIDNLGSRKNDEAGALKKALEEERLKHEKELAEAKMAAEKAKEEAELKVKEEAERLRKELEEAKASSEKRETSNVEDDRYKGLDEKTKKRLLELDEEKAKRIESASKAAAATGADLAAIKKNIEAEYKQREEKLLGKSKKKLGNGVFSSSESEPETKKASLQLVVDKGGLVEFGLYPQTHVNSPEIIAKLNVISKPEPNGWYLLDGKHYAKAFAKPHAYYEFEDGSKISEGSEEWFLCEPIKWRVLEKGGGEAYLLSDLLLDAHRFDKESNDFDKSEIKSWLNYGFKKRAFSGCLESMIAGLSLPSKEDVENASFGFFDDESRKAKPTDWALASGAFQINGCGYYWTRSPYSGWFDSAEGVSLDGGIGGADVGRDDYGVRPGLRVKIAE